MRRRLGGALGIAFLASVAALGAVQQAGASISAPVKLTKVVSGLSSPIAFAWRGPNSPMFVAEQPGQIVTVQGGKVTGTALSLNVQYGGEQGLLGIAFSTDGTKLYVDYNGPDNGGDIQIVEYTMSGNVANAATRRPLLTIPHSTFTNHNGGDLVMGARGKLYISVGDGGGGGDTLHNGQNKNSLLAKILRIDPTPSGSMPYSIPAGNPFVGDPNARPETWMWGLRNPWRFSLDRKTHDMWIGDVGQDAWEEIDYAKAGEKGINWGWPLREGKHAYDGAPPPGARDPILERSHNSGDCAITGGYVYRGTAIKGFQGTYVFGDTCTGELRAVQQQHGKVVQARDLKLNVPSISSFGESPSGEIFAASLNGVVYRLSPK